MYSNRWYEFKHWSDITTADLPFVESPFFAANYADRCLSSDATVGQVVNSLAGSHFRSMFGSFPGRGSRHFRKWRDDFVRDVERGDVLLVFKDKRKPFCPLIAESEGGLTPTNSEPSLANRLMVRADPPPPPPPAITGEVSDVSSFNGNLGWSSERRDDESYRASQIKPGKVTSTGGTSNTTSGGEKEDAKAETSDTVTPVAASVVPTSPEDMVLEMDCGGYPFEEAPYFKMSESTERWEVRPTVDNGGSARSDETSSTAELKKAFRRYVDRNKLSVSEIRILDEMLQPHFGKDFTAKGLSGDQIVKNLNELNKKPLKSMPPAYKISYHHLRPTWAGGENENNLFPIRPGHQTAGVHRWWDSKLADSATPEQRVEMLGGSEEPTVNKISENNIGKIAERLMNKKPPKRLVVEMCCPEACPI
ncbi:hypothetical protein ONV78_05010 [Hahella sp. CR1]|uniref:hypothetical protein n=1 Tax=Hahella sp. CR1 TaxID=2992807 RepID=UPI002441BBAA|nr:hypothetical protein [Hahella sp. CR1]MDG9667088.1 hypothetical protein [Hahella sp. CR1]